MATEKSFAFGAARKPGSPPATADSVTSLHPWTGRSNGGSYSPRSTSPPTGSPAPSEADLAQERSPAGGLLQAHMFEVGRQLACPQCMDMTTPDKALHSSNNATGKLPQARLLSSLGIGPLLFLALPCLPPDCLLISLPVPSCAALWQAATQLVH